MQAQRSHVPPLERYLKRLWSYVRAERRLAIASLAFGGIGLALPFVFPHLIGLLVDGVLTDHPAQSPLFRTAAQRIDLLKMLTVASVAAAAAFALVGYAKGHYTLMLGNRVIGRLRQELFDHLQRLPLAFFTQERSGTLVWQLLQEVNGVANLIYAGALLVTFDAIQITAAIICLFVLSPPLAGAILVVLPVYAAILAVLNPPVRRASDAVNRQWEAMSADLQEQFSAIALTRAYGAEARESRNFKAHSKEQLQNILHQSRLGHAMGAASEGVIHLGTATIIGYGGWLALHDPRFSIGMLTEFLGYVGIMYGPIRRCADLNLVYQNSWASLKRVMEIFEIKPQIVDGRMPAAIVPLKGEVSFRHVYFRYESSCGGNSFGPVVRPQVKIQSLPSKHRPHTLSDVQITIGSGERVALVGSSGAGKSTVASLLLRLFDVDSGSILVDGIDVREYTVAALRTAMAIVQQDTFLFSGTIRENIAYSDPDAAHDTVQAAATAANAHMFISGLPDGYETRIGERGYLLSGGQRQRISIARAVLKNPRILILDEATSALDAQSEFLVQQALDRLMVGRSSLIIAHRLSTIRQADRIYAMEEGRILECGTHDQLMRTDGYYARFVAAQLKMPAPIRAVAG